MLNKVYINRKTVNGPWGGGNMWVKNAYDIFPLHGIKTVEINEDPDTIILAGIFEEGNCISAAQAIQYKNWQLQRGKKIKIILRVNENDARKGTKNIDDVLKNISYYVDSTVFVSKWLMDYFIEKEWKCSNNQFIHNGVDKKIFKPNQKIGNKKINIVTHHWSDNYLKGFDVYSAIDDWLKDNQDFTFTYIGRSKISFKNIKTIEPLFGEELGKELGKYDLYVSASRYDPGPNHILESLACNIPTYVHKDGGGCVEFAGENHSYNDTSEILNILASKSYSNNSWCPPTWEECMLSFSRVVKL